VNLLAFLDERVVLSNSLKCEFLKVVLKRRRRRRRRRRRPLTIVRLSKKKKKKDDGFPTTNLHKIDFIGLPQELFLEVFHRDRESSGE